MSGEVRLVDSSGRPLSLYPRGVLAQNSGQRSMAILGDSLVERYWPNLVSVSSIQYATGVATVTTGAAHGLWPGLLTAIRGATPSFINGQVTVLTVPSATTFTYAIPGTASGTATGSPYLLSSNNLTHNASIFSYVQMLTNFKFNVVCNAGLSGDSTAGTIGRLGEVIASGAKDCWVLVGINDVTNNVPVSTITANLNTIYQTLLSNGIQVHARTLLGYGASAGATSAQISAMNLVNKWIRLQGNTPGIFVVDYHAAMQDPASATGLSLAANMDAAGTVHPSPAGCMACAQLDKAAFNAIFPQQPNILPENQADKYSAASVISQALDNPTFQGTTLATSWLSFLGSVTTTDSVVARTNGADGDTCGNNQQRLYVNAAGAGQTANLYQTASNSSVAAGDIVSFSLDAQLSSVTANVSGFFAYIRITTGGIDYFSYAGLRQVSQGLTTDNLRARIITPPMLVPGTPTLVQALLSTTFGGNASPVLLAGRAGLLKLN